MPRRAWRPDAPGCSGRDELLQPLDSCPLVVQLLHAFLDDREVAAQVVGDARIQRCPVFRETRHDLGHDRQRQAAIQQEADASDRLDGVRREPPVSSRRPDRRQQPVLLLVAQRAHARPGALGALDELREQGKIRHIGLSEITVEQLEQARRDAPIASVRNLYNLSVRGSDPVVDHTAQLGIAFIPFFPLAIGEHTREGTALDHVARQLGVLPGQVALAWLLHRAPNVLPIPGTTSIAHLEQNVAAAGIRLTPEQIELVTTP